MTHEKAIKNYLKAIRKGMFKVFAKMGISTIQSYRGAQIFEAIGLSEDVVHEYFAGTPSKISGVTVEVLGEECLRRHTSRGVETPDLKNTLSKLGANIPGAAEGVPSSQSNDNFVAPRGSSENKAEKPLKSSQI